MSLNMSLRDGEGSNPPTSSTSSSPPSRAPSVSDLLVDDPLREAVLANIESLQDTLAETPLLKECEDEPSIIGSHGLPLLDLAPSTPLSVSPGSPPPHLGAPLLPTPPTSPVNIHVFDSDEESPCADLNTPLKFDCNEATWRPSEEVLEPRLSPTRVIPTIDYLQVPPHHRAKLRKRRRVSFSKGADAPGIPSPPVCPTGMPALTEAVVTEPPLEESSEDDLVEESVQANGGVLQVPGPVAERSSNLSAANCVIKIPKKQRKPSFSNIDIPCYHRRPSGQALDVNFDYTFTVVRCLRAGGGRGHGGDGGKKENKIGRERSKGIEREQRERKDMA